MSHITKEEYLSAFLDGEAGSFEQQRLCDQLESDDLMRDKLASFALIGEAVRNQSQSTQALASGSFLKGIQDAIVDEAVPEQDIVDESATVIPANVAKRRIFPKQAAGYAIAASVAAVAAISIQNYFSGSTPDMVASTPVVNSAPAEVKPAVMTASLGTNAVYQPKVETISYRLPDAETRGIINKYVAHHLQYASSTTLMPSVRAVSYSTDY